MQATPMLYITEVCNIEILDNNDIMIERFYMKELL